MKQKHFIMTIAAAVLFAVGCNDKESVWNNAVDDMDVRLTNLEKLCAEANTNITSLQTIINAQEGNDQVKTVTEIRSEGKVVGYTITFGKNDPITIYNGKDGKNVENGQDGTNGTDGVTPVIGVKKHTDNVYYWTLNGAWLLDASGQKLRVTGKDGANGTDGTNGTNGTNGNDGITPQLKIENGYWMISYDNGSTWTQAGKATGENGQDGQDGEDGESVFSSVTYDEHNVYFTLADGTVITIDKGNGASGNVEIVDGAIMAAFSVSDTKKVYFSQGNLQYNAALGTHLCADGTIKPGTWRFAEHWWDCVGGTGTYDGVVYGNVYYNGIKCSNDLVSASYDGWIDLFAWGTSGWHNPEDPYNINYEPWSISQKKIDSSDKYNMYGYGPSGNMQDVHLIGTSQWYDWGRYNAISNGGNIPNQWRTLSSAEVEYLGTRRSRAEYLYEPHAKVCIGAYIITVDIFCPDNFIPPADVAWKNVTVYSSEQVESLQRVGCVFMFRSANNDGNPLEPLFRGNIFWLRNRRDSYSYSYKTSSATIWDLSYANNLYFHDEYRYERHLVRLVKDVK